MTAAGKDTRTYAELCKAAVELEREFKWSAAADLYALASKKAKHPPARQAAITKKEAALKNAAADDAEPRGLIGAVTETQERHMAEMLGHRAPVSDDVLAGPPAGAVEAAMPVASFDDPVGPGAAEESDALLAEHGELSPGPTPTIDPEMLEDAKAAVEAVRNAPKIPKPKKETTMTTTEKLSDREAMLAKKERVRMKQNKIEIGTELQHIRRGKTLARCTYAAERQFVYKGKVYSSLSDAGSAAAKDIGLKNPSVNGWIFWGVEKREA